MTDYIEDPYIFVTLERFNGSWRFVVEYDNINEEELLDIFEELVEELEDRRA